MNHLFQKLVISAQFQIFKKKYLAKLKIDFFYKQIPQCKDWCSTPIGKVMY